MLRIYKGDSTGTSSAEYVFNTRVQRVLLHKELVTPILQEFGYYWIGDDVMSPFGKGKLTEISIACKLSVCLLLFPGLIFNTYGVAVKDIGKILKSQSGNLCCDIKTPVPYYQLISAVTAEGRPLRDTTELNLYLFKEDSIYETV